MIFLNIILIFNCLSMSRRSLTIEEVENLREGLRKKLQQLNHAYGQMSHRNNTEVYAAM